MKLKYNNFLIITPVFVLLGLILASFNYSIEKKEVLWGLDEELKSIAVASAIFLKEEKDHIHDKKISISETFDRILSFGRVKRLVLLEDERVIVENFSEDVNASSKAYNKVKEYTESEIYKEGSLYLVDAYIPIKESEFSLMVSLDAGYVKESLENEFIEAIIITCVLSFVGVLISILISFIVTNKISKLNVLAQALTNGKYSTRIELGKVKEFSDLAQTLNIMKSILQEMLFKTRNTYLQEDLFVNDRELSKKFTQDFKYVDKLKSKGIEINILDTKNHFSHQSYNIFEDENSIYAYNLELKHSSDASMEMAIEASSLNFYLEKNIVKETFDPKSLQPLYDIDYLELLVINKTTKEVKQTSVLNNAYEITSFVLAEEEMKVLNKNKILNNRYVNYIKAYNQLVFDELCADLKNIFQSDEVILVIKVT